MIAIRTAERGDIPALLDIYNYEVEYGVATFDLQPKSLEPHAEDGLMTPESSSWAAVALRAKSFCRYHVR